MRFNTATTNNRATFWKTCVRSGIGLCGIAVVTGCEGDSGGRPAPPASSAAASSAPSAPMAPTAPAVPAAVETDESTPPETTTTVQSAAEPGAIIPEREQATVGVGKKGRGYGGGLYTEPIRQKFRIEQRLVFEIQIPDGLKTFKAIHDRAPKDFAEFKREILDPADIKLPELPEGDRYVYDAQEEELMVEHTMPTDAPKDVK